MPKRNNQKITKREKGQEIMLTRKKNTHENT